MKQVLTPEKQINIKSASDSAISRHTPMMHGRDFPMKISADFA
jgi:hypothetical protein